MKGCTCEKKHIRRRGLLVWAIVVAVAICLAIGVGIYQRVSLEQHQSAVLDELRNHEGEYDAQSIVLSDTTAHVAEALAEKYDATLRITSNGRYATLTLPEGVTILDVYEDDANLSDLKLMSIDYHAEISEVSEVLGKHGHHRRPGRPKYNTTDKSYLRQTYLDYLNLDSVWSMTTGNGITVAIIDTGIDTDHPEFQGRISEYSYNATEDKIVKDYNDWSLIEDEQGHGTSVAGVLAASMNGGDIVGVAPGVEIIVIKAECDESGRFERTSDLVFGLYYAIERDVSVVNMSFGTPDRAAFAAPAQLAYDSDVICVAAAGNDGNAIPTYPAALDTVFGVGALDADSWELAEYSNYGDNVDIVAPGTVYTTAMGGKYTVSVGTSLASPLAAGVIALHMSREYYTEFATLEERLYASCYDLGDLGEDWYYGYGAVDASALIMEETGKVTFNMMTDELENTEQLFIRNHTLQNMPEPERLYAVFEGWYYDPQCTEEYVWYEDRFSTDLTLYAKWINEDDGLPYIYVELEDGTIEIREYTGRRKYITIPDYIEGKKVSSIGEDAFSGETGLREVNLPKYLVKIRDRAFKNCANLVSIELPDTVTVIGSEAFSDNVRLSYVALGENSKLASIGDYAFSGCANLSTFTVPSGVTELDGLAFMGTTSMRSFAVQAGNTAFAADNGVLFSKDGSTLVCYPAGLKGVYTLPAKVTAIADGGFGFTSLETVDLSGVKAIGNKAFFGSKLQSVAIPDSVTTLGVAAFSSSFALKTVTLGKGLTAIPDEAFGMCTMLQSITIPQNVQEIGGMAFEKTYSLRTLEFADNSTLAYIGLGAFACSGIESLTIPGSVQMIDSQAFCMNMAMTALAFEQGSQPLSIGAEAFAENTGVTAVTLPARLVSIGDLAFKSLGLSTVTVPAGVTSLGRGAFAACRSLENIFVDDGNTAYTDVDGVVYNTAGTTLVMYPAGNARSYYDVKSGVTAIEEHAFHGAWVLNGVFLPASLQEIRAYAFYDMTMLLSMNIPDNVMQISNYAFAGDYQLSNVNFTENSKLPRISYGAFAYCGLQSFRVPASVSTMAQGAFEGCEDLTSFTFAANSRLESISAYMFDGCNNLQSITFESGSALNSIQAHGLEGMRKLTTLDLGGAKLTNIDNFAFRFCESLTNVTIPSGVEYIGRYAFYYCSSLSEITIPASVEYIGRYAFLGTNNASVYFSSNKLPAYLQEDWDHGTSSYYLGVIDVATSGDWKYAQLSSGGVSIISYLGNATSVDLTTLNLGGNIVSIGGNAFANSGVEAITIPQTVTHILARAFYRSALKQVTIPANVEFIGAEAFADTPIEQLSFAGGARVSVIERSAFEDTEKLTAVTIPASVTRMGRAVFKNSGISTLVFESNIALAEIPEDAFSYTSITEVTIPNSVTLINHNAFRETSKLVRVNFGTGSKLHIGSNAFYLSGLKALTIPANVEYIGEYAFVGLNSLENYSVDGANPYYMAKDGLLMSKDGRKLIAVPAGRKGIQVVPSTVEIIGFGAFENSLLDKIIFPDDANILSFGYRAFYNAKNLTGITVPSSVVSIDYYAFANCGKLNQVVFMEGNRLTGVYEGAFYGCNSLVDFELPSSVAEISEFAFYGCSGLTKIPVPEGTELKGIYDYSMAYTGLSGELVIPETVMDIGAYAFMGTRIDKVTIPADQAKTLLIGIGAFRDCNYITEITVPFIGASFDDDDITWFGYIFGAGDVGANASYVPESLKIVNINGDITTLGYGAFFNLESLEKLNVPASITKVAPSNMYFCDAEYELKNTVLFVDSEGNPNSTLLFSDIGSGLIGTLKVADGPSTIAIYNMYHFSGIEIPSSVTRIEALNSYNLKDLVIPENVRCDSSSFSGVGRSAIWDSVTISKNNPYHTAVDGVIYNKDMTEIISVTPAVSANITLPNTLTTIPENAFRERNVINVVIPEGVTSIHKNAFYLARVKTITLPSTLKAIGTDAFAGTRIETIYNNSDLQLDFWSSDYGGIAQSVSTIVEKDGTVRTANNQAQYEYAEKDEFLFRRQTGGSWQLIGYTGNQMQITLPLTFNGQQYDLYEFSSNARKIIVPEGIERIGDGAFEYNELVETITLPSSLKEIGNSAFYNCNSMKEIVIPEAVHSIGASAFSGCSALESINIPSNVGYIGEGVFSTCRALKNIDVADSNTYCSKEGNIIYYKNSTAVLWVSSDIKGDVRLKEGLLSIGEYAFSDCVNITTIDIPESVVEIGYSAFAGCTGLTEITLPNEVKTLPSNVFSGCTNLEQVKLPDSLTQISFGAFSACFSLEEINIPDSCESIGEYAFNNCTSLKKVSFGSNLNTIENSFGGCKSLTDIVIPDTNPYFAIENCILYNKEKTNVISVLASVTGAVILPDSVREIGRAFNSSNISNVVIPEGVTSIPQQAFGVCANLETVILPSTVNTIESHAFWSCTALKSIILPDGIASIDEYAFVGCKALTSVKLPASLVSIGQGAFETCNNLTHITIPAGVKEIGPRAFYGGHLYSIVNNSDLVLEMGSEEYGNLAQTAVHIIDKNGNSTYYTDPTGLVEYTITEDDLLFKKENGQYYLIAYIGDNETITLPLTYEGKEYLINSMKGVHGVILPNGMKEINGDAFYQSSVDDITIPDSVTLIGWGAFYECHALRSINLPSNLKTIGGSAFAYSGLTSIDIPDGVTCIDYGAFENCASFTDITIPDSCAVIGSYAFLSTPFISNEDNWHDGLLCVGNHLVSADSEIREITLAPDTVVADDILTECDYLTKITFGGSTKLIGRSEASPIPNLETVVITKAPSEGVYVALGRAIPMTLSNIVIADGVQMREGMFADIEGVTIYVEASEKDVRWDENFPGWSNGNRVVYGDDWIWADFYAEDGSVLSSQVLTTSQIIRQPWAADYEQDGETYLFRGYDMDGDGKADMIPATSTTNISAKVVYEMKWNCDEHGHKYEGWTSDHESHWHECVMCGIKLDPAKHVFDGADDIKCDICDYAIYIPGDLTGDELMDTDDAVYLMMSIFFPNQYPLNQICDFNNSGSVDTDDAIYLMMAVFFPDQYPVK